MFTLILILINLWTIVVSLIHIGETSNQPKSTKDKNDDDGMNIPCA